MGRTGHRVAENIADAFRVYAWPSRAMPPSKTYKTTLEKEGMLCRIPVPFDPKTVFGQSRALQMLKNK